MPAKRPAPEEAGLPLPRVERPRRSDEQNTGLSSKAQRQEFFLPVTGFAWFYQEEVRIINHPAFQRLGRIYQLGQSHLVYRGATHKRIEHVLGAVHIAQQMISAVNFNVEKSQASGRPGFAAKLSDQEQRFIRLGALLHDIGHVAAGHTLEDELGLIRKHDEDERLDDIFESSDWDNASERSQPTLRTLIDNQYRAGVPAGLAAEGLSATDIARLLIRKRPQSDDRHARIQNVLEQSTEIRYHVCSNMIGNTICADLLDYIYRDWYHIGKPREPDDRIFQYMEIRRSTDTLETSNGALPHAEDRFVIALGQKTRIRTDGVSAILGLLEWRYELAEAVLLHRTKVSAAAMLDRALFELWEKTDPRELVKRILLLSDEELLDKAIDEAREPAKQNIPARAAISILRKLRDRDLFKELGTFDSTNLVGPRITKIKETYAPIGTEAAKGASNRAATARLLEYNFDLPPGSIAIYCSQIYPKIAEVSVAVDQDIKPFNLYEQENKKRLSGGHLEAQVERFERLWRIHFFIDSEAKDAMPRDKFILLYRFIDEIVLSIDEPTQLTHKVKEKALVYVHHEQGRGARGIEYADRPLTAARGDPSVSLVSEYPNGAPSMKLFTRETTAGG